MILENFIEVVTGDSTDQNKFNEFVEVWTKLDPDAGVSFATSGSNVNNTMWFECCLQLNVSNSHLSLPVLDLTAEEISIDLLPDLLIQLPPPLGLKSKDVTPALLMQVIKDLHIPIHNKRIRYKDTFLAWYGTANVDIPPPYPPFCSAVSEIMLKRILVISMSKICSVKRTIVSPNHLEDKDDDDDGFTKPKGGDFASGPTSQGADTDATVDVHETDDITR